MMYIIISILSVIAVIMGIAWELSIPTFLVFLILKLCNVINWSWLCVCIPLIVLAVSLFLTILLSLIVGDSD